MIYIYCDFHKTQSVKQDAYTWVASQISHYIPLRQKLRRALDDEGNTYTLYIQDQVLARWFSDLKYYDHQVVHWEEINLRDRFYKKFGFSPPSELNDAAIQHLQLLKLTPPSHSKLDDPTGWILGHYLGAVWQPLKPYSGHLADLAAWAVEKTHQVEALLIPLAKTRLTAWQQSNTHYQIFLNQSWQTAGEQILLTWALKTYPNDFELRQQLTSVPQIDCQPHKQLCIPVLKKVEAELRQFWQVWFITSPSPSIPAAIRLMSGLANAELSELENWLKAHPVHLTIPMLDSIRHHFALLPEIAQTIKRLENLIAPPVPQTPDDTWSTETWLTWATDEYMPYFAWVIRHNQARDTQIMLANHFADWLVSAYPSFMFNKNAPFITNQQSYLQELLNTDQTDVVLWLIVDGLTWWQGKQLAENFADYGLTLAQLEPSLSALPSLTFISKRALVQGYLDQSTENQPIKKVLAKRLAQNTFSTHIYTHTTQFESAISASLQAGLHVLFYNALDKHNHETQSFTDDESVEGHLRLLARLTQEGFEQCTKQGLKVRALVSSDHGSTLLPRPTKVLNIPAFAQAVDDEDTVDDTLDKNKKTYQRTRACAIEQEPNQDTLTQIEQDWHLLRQDIFNLPKHFLLPKGYAAVKRQPKGWTHGGATPEETVSPFIEVQPELIQVLSPVVKIEGFLLPTQSSTLQITVTNPNSTPLHTVRFNFSHEQTAIEWPKIRAKSQSSQEFTALAATSQGKTQPVEWVLTCQAGGRQHQFSKQEEIPVRRFQVSEVDDLFEDML